MHRLLLTGVALVASAVSVRAGANDYFTEHARDFGTTPRGPVLVHYFLLRNTTAQPVQIGQPRVSCGCVSATVLKPVLAPGETSAVVAYMDTRRIPMAGVTRTVTVYVPFLSPTLEEVHLKVSAIARDDLVMTPETLAFGTVRKGQGGKAAVRLTFYSDPNWRMTGATSTGAYIKPAVAEAQRAGNQVSYDVTAELDPACPVGNWTADVWLATGTAGLERLRVPVTVAVVAPIAVNPGAVSFGDVKVGGSTEQRVVLQGGTPFKVVGVQGADDAVKVAAAADAARPVHVLTVTLTPKAAGSLTRNLVVVTDSKEQPTVTVPLTGRVVE